MELVVNGGSYSLEAPVGRSLAENTQDLESCLERIRATDGISRTVTEVVLSTLFER